MIRDVELYKPELKEPWFKEKMLNDKETMSYNHAYGGTVLFKPDRWPSWYKKWILDEKEHYYRYLRLKDSNEFVGEIAIHKENSKWLSDILIYAPFRKRGYGQKGLEYLLQEARRRRIAVLYDEIARDNPSISLFLENGFTVELENEKTVTVKLLID